VDIRALAFDLDGTLLRADESLSPRNRDALRAARRAGLHVIIATARWYHLAEEVARELDGDGTHTDDELPVDGPVVDGPVIACSGAEVRLLRERVDLLDLRLPEEFADAVYDVCDTVRCVAWVVLGDEVLVKMDGTMDSTVPALRQVDSLRAAAQGEAPRMILVQGTQAAAAVEATSPMWDGAVRFDESFRGAGKRLLTLTALGADKGVALAVACGALGIAPDTVVAFGDAPNDVPMFRVAGASFAMGQAPPSVCAEASALTATNAEDGVAIAVEELLRSGDGALG
jgi:hydroxymethylpyrimidine pyrophosphatase-like HAD family hydrolase